jgi:PKD repeat protein
LQADFVWKKDSLQPNKVYFRSIVTSPAANLQYQWKFGDGDGSYEPNPTHVYTQPGTYKVCLVVTTNNICKVEVCKEIEIRVSCNVEPKFTWKFEENNPRKIFFYNLTIVTTTSVKYEWKFGDGTYSNEKDPVHLYERGGEYEVCLTVKVGEDCKKTICQKLVIRECDVHARFESKRDASQWNKVWFANLSHPVSNIWRTSWTYGDGSSSQDFNSFHVYQEPGKYVVCLKVQSLQGCIDAYCDTIVVRRPDTCENHSDFRFEASANNPQEIHFKPKQVNLTWKYYWEFGDGKWSTAVAPIHKYEHPGVYKVCLTVVSSLRCRTTTCKEVRVASRINCDSVRVKFEYKRNTTKPNEISFYAIGSIPIIKQKWAIQKVSLPVTSPVIIEGNNPTYTFKDTGWYLVCLYAVTLGDCQKIYCERIHIDRLGNRLGSIPVLTGSPVLVYPNPATSMARIEFEMESAGPVILRILDAAGSVQLSLSVAGQAGNNSINVPVDRLGNGFYMVEIRYANRLKLAKFQKS